MRWDDIDALIKMYKKYRETWAETYGKRVQKLIRSVVKVLEETRNLKDPKILVLGAGTPIRFPKELDRNTTVVDKSEKVKELWSVEGRHAKFIVDDVEKAIRDMGESHDIIVLPAILSWLSEDKRKRISKEVEKLHKRGKVIVAWETTHVRRGYAGHSRFSEAFPQDWHKKYLGNGATKFAIGIWAVSPLPLLSPAHIVDPGEEWFVEGSVKGLTGMELEKLREKMRDIESNAAKEAIADPTLMQHIERHYPHLIKRFKTSPT